MNKIIAYKNELEIMNDKKISVFNMIYIFIICSMLGWCFEVGFVFLDVGRIVDRGMLFGPFCSIYGFGALIMYLLFYNLKPSLKNIPYTFIVSSIILGAFELLSGLGLKYIFHVEMWNYDGKFLEILNYTTVPILIGWGILGTLYIFFIQPFFNKILRFIPECISKKLAIILLILYFINFVFSIFNIYLNPEVLYKLVNP